MSTKGKAMDQFFLTNPKKIRSLLDAADIQSHESLLELGAGRGSVAKFFPACRLVSLLELDGHLAKNLRQVFPQAKVINADVIKSLPSLSFDVLLSNLPYNLTDQVIAILKRKRFRCAVMAIKIDHDICAYQDVFSIDEIVVLDKQDFMPAQTYRSRLVRLEPRKGSAVYLINKLYTSRV